MRSTIIMMLWPGQLCLGPSPLGSQPTPFLQLWDKTHKALKPLAREQILSPTPPPCTHSRSLNSREEQGLRGQKPGESRSQQEDGNPFDGWPTQSSPCSWKRPAPGHPPRVRVALERLLGFGAPAPSLQIVCSG